MAALAVAVPAAAGAKPGNGKGHGKADQHAVGKGKSKPKTVTYVFKGTVASVDSGAGTVTVTVAKGNHWARQFKGQDVTFSLTGSKHLKVQDFDKNGTRDLADVQPGDSVIVQAKLPKSAAGDQPFAARQLIDLAKQAGSGDSPEAPEAD
ncbi:MAG: hypothetical protein ACJ76V_11305 [Thermoleophilaceae bacterium]